MTVRSSGTKSEQRVGMPTPRFTIQPSSNSAATRAAIRSRDSRLPSVLMTAVSR